MQEQGLIKDFQGQGKSKIIVSKTFAEKNNIKVGGKVRVITPNYDTNRINNIENQTKRSQYDLRLEVIDIVEDNITCFREVMIDLSNTDLIENDRSKLRKIYIDTENINVEQDLKEIKKSYPSIKWATLNEVVEETTKAINERWNFFKIALILIILTTVLGSINSIKNNINSKRKEYSILRCMKFKEKDLRKMLIDSNSCIFTNW